MGVTAGQKLCLPENAFISIFEFLDFKKELLRVQMISRLFYEQIVPKVLIRANVYPRTKVVMKINNTAPLKMHHLKNTGAVVTAQYSVNGGGTGREFPRNLIDHEHGYTLKWYETNSS